MSRSGKAKRGAKADATSAPRRAWDDVTNTGTERSERGTLMHRCIYAAVQAGTTWIDGCGELPEQLDLSPGLERTTLTGPDRMAGPMVIVERLHALFVLEPVANSPEASAKPKPDCDSRLRAEATNVGRLLSRFLPDRVPLIREAESNLPT